MMDLQQIFKLVREFGLCEESSLEECKDFLTDRLEFFTDDDEDAYTTLQTLIEIAQQKGVKDDLLIVKTGPSSVDYAILRLSKDCKKELIGLDKSIKEILETLLGL